MVTIVMTTMMCITTVTDIGEIDVAMAIVIAVYIAAL
jgi:hypothetical protein